MNRKRIVLAFAGDARSCAAVKWLTESCGADVAALVVDVGQQDDLEEMRARAIGCGAVRAHVLDRCEAFVRDVILPATAAPAPPDGDALRRLAHPVIAAALLEVAAIEGAGAVAYVRRRIARCTYPRPRSGDASHCAGRGVDAGHECGRAGGHLLMRRPAFGGGAAHVTIEFHERVPVSVNDVPMELRELIEILSLIGGEYAARYRRPAGAGSVACGVRACGGRGSITLQLHHAQPPGESLMTLWSGRFDTAPDPAAFDFGVSFGFDRLLFEDDVTGSIAWAEALEAAGMLSPDDARTIIAALKEILDEGRRRPESVAGPDEDAQLRRAAPD